MALSMLELFRTLASFEPAPVDLRGAPWERYTDWSISQGLATLAAYNLEYRLPSSGAPVWAKDRLLAIYQGSANDNVMKLVNFKRIVDEVEGRRMVLLGGANWAEVLYPHVAFRPVIDVRLMVAPGDVEPLVGLLRNSQFLPAKPDGDPFKADAAVTDKRSIILLHAAPVGIPAEDEALLKRAMPVRVYGPSMFRLELEDALLLQAVMLARAGFEAPLIELVDLRELVLGAPSLGGPYSRQPDADTVLRRAEAWKAERALYAAMALVERLFPEAAEAAARLKPSTSLPVRELLEHVVVAPVANLERTHALKGEEVLRALLAG